MAKQYTRQEVRRRLREEVEQKKALLMFGAGTGLTAKCAELGGADLIGVYSTARFRMMGRPSLLAWLPYGDANEHVSQMAQEILPVIKETPCIAGVGAHDPGLNFQFILEDLMAMGFSGVTNEPFAGIYGPEFASQLDAAGLGFGRERSLIEAAHKMGIFTVAWAFSPDEGRQMAEAGADVIGAIVGVTVGGLTGAARSSSLEEATRQVQAICRGAHEVNPDILVLAHGGPFKDVETARYAVDHSDCVGYAAGSSGERIPTETAIVGLTKEYKEIGLKLRNIG